MIKTVLITGGTGLIGKGLTLYLLKKEYKIVITSRGTDKNKFITENNLQAYENNLEILELDYFVDSSTENLVKRLGSLKIYPDVIIHNARSLDTLKIEKNGESSVNNLMREFRMGVAGPYELNNLILNSPIGSKLKNIILISSIYGVVAPNSNLYDDFENQSPIQYGLTKASQIHLSKELAVRLTDKGIRVNTVSFGGVEGRANEAFKAKYSSFTPARKMLKIEEVVKPIAFLISEGSNGMTGHNLIVDGGWTIW